MIHNILTRLAVFAVLAAIIYGGFYLHVVRREYWGRWPDMNYSLFGRGPR